MKYAAPELIEFLNSNQQFRVVDLYDIDLVAGASLRYTSFDGQLDFNGNIYDGRTIIIERGMTRTVIGLEVDTLDLIINALPTHLIGNVPFLQALRNGALDGAAVTVRRCFMPEWGDVSLGAVILFMGKVSDMDVGRTKAEIRVNSDLHLLNIQMPRNIYQPGCINTLYDGACTMIKDTFGVAGSIISTSTVAILKVSQSHPPGYFDLGTVTFTNGVNAGVSRSIKQATPGNFVLMSPLVSVPDVGDTLIAYPGCNKTMQTCKSKFSNLNNFRGFPFVPAPESVT